MTRLRRVLNVISGIIVILAGVALFIIPADDGIKFVLFFMGTAMTFRGLGILYYYLTMAKHMVGGRNVLYRGMIFLDLGILASSLIEHPMAFAVIYIALLHVFNGAVSVLRANEARKYGGHWRLKMAYGVTHILLALAVVVIGVGMGQMQVAVWAYAAGIIYSSCLKIATAFRRTSIVYIQ